jgi:hypothetical protein
VSAETPMQPAPCEHHWGSLHEPGHQLYWVRQCTICHAVDWDDLDAEIGKLAGDREDNAHLVERRRVLDAARSLAVLMTRVDGAEVAAVQWSALLEALGLKP